MLSEDVRIVVLAVVGAIVTLGSAYIGYLIVKKHKNGKK